MRRAAGRAGLVPREMHSWKARCSMVVRVAGRVTSRREVQRAKAWQQMVVRAVGRATSRREVLCANASALMVVRVAGSVSLVSEVQHACEETRPTHRWPASVARTADWPRVWPKLGAA